MSRKTYAQILDVVARRRVPETLDLTPQILSRIQKRKRITMQPRVRVFVTIMICLLVLAVTAFSVPAVRAAIQRWFGYVPGVGLLPEGSIRVLAEPSSVTQQGFTLTVNEAVLSNDKTFIKYTLTGLSSGMVKDADPCPIEQVQPIIRLPDGSELALRGYGTDYSTDPNVPSYYNGNATFSAMPVNVNEATLLLPCLSQIDTSLVPRDWEVSLRFVPAPPEMTIAPVIKVAPAQDKTNATTASASLPELKITKIVPVEGGYLLAGTIQVDVPDGLTVDESDGYLEEVTITDANGQEVTYGSAPFDFMPEELVSPPKGSYGWTCQISGKSFAWPLTMTVHSVTAVTAPYPPVQFQFDSGSNPQVDRPILLSLDVPMGAKTVHVVSVAPIQKGNGFDGYEFTFVYDPSFDFSIEITDHFANGGGGGGPDSAGNFTKALGYQDGLPTGTLTVVLHGYGVVHLPGPWQFTLNDPTP
jgi:hypothetical protein